MPVRQKKATPQRGPAREGAIIQPPDVVHGRGEGRYGTRGTQERRISFGSGQGVQEKEQHKELGGQEAALVWRKAMVRLGRSVTKRTSGIIWYGWRPKWVLQRKGGGLAKVVRVPGGEL